MQNIKIFLENQGIEFENEEQLVRWMRSIKPKTIVRVGKSYFINESEMLILFKKHLKNKEKLRQKRIIAGRYLGKQTTKNKKIDSSS